VEVNPIETQGLRRVFKSRKRGAILVGRVMPALYATSEGHRFTRGQYLAVAVAPAVTISLLGFVACFSQWAGT
jgi:Putative zincin peptidase